MLETLLKLQKFKTEEYSNKTIYLILFRRIKLGFNENIILIFIKKPKRLF